MRLKNNTAALPQNPVRVDSGNNVGQPDCEGEGSYSITILNGKGIRKFAF